MGGILSIFEYWGVVLSNIYYNYCLGPVAPSYYYLVIENSRGSKDKICGDDERFANVSVSNHAGEASLV